MALQSHGGSLLQGSLQERIFPIGSTCGMTSSKRRLRGSHYMEVNRAEMKRRILPLQERVKGKLRRSPVVGLPHRN